MLFGDMTIETLMLLLLPLVAAAALIHTRRQLER